MSSLNNQFKECLMRRVWVFLVAISLSSCSSFDSYQKGEFAYSDGDYDKAESLWLEATGSEDSWASYMATEKLVKLYDRWDGRKKDFAKHLMWMIKLVEHSEYKHRGGKDRPGGTESEIAYAYLIGFGTTKDVTRACNWYERGFKAGGIMAARLLRDRDSAKQLAENCDSTMHVVRDPVYEAWVTKYPESCGGGRRAELPACLGPDCKAACAGNTVTLDYFRRNFESLGTSFNKNAADLFLSTALSLRTAFAIHSELARQYYDLMPQTAAADLTYKKVRPMLWSLMFRDSIVRVADISSISPIALYYNPLIDVVVFTKWQQKDGRRYDLIEMIALPGEIIDSSDMSQSFSSFPRWLMNHRESEFRIHQITQQRLQKMAQRFPINPEDGGSISKAIDIKRSMGLQNVAEQRVLVHVAQLRASLQEPLKGHIKHLLATLQTGGKTQIIQIVNNYNAQDIDKLMNMDISIRRQLELSALYRSEDGSSLILFSLPQDGSIFLLALMKSPSGKQVKVERIGIMDLRASSVAH